MSNPEAFRSLAPLSGVRISEGRLAAITSCAALAACRCDIFHIPDELTDSPTLPGAAVSLCYARDAGSQMSEALIDTVRERPSKSSSEIPFG